MFSISSFASVYEVEADLSDIYLEINDDSTYDEFYFSEFDTVKEKKTKDKTSEASCWIVEITCSCATYTTQWCNTGPHPPINDWAD